LTFTASNDRGTVNQGDILGAGGPVLLRVQSNAPPGFTTIVSDGTRALAMARDAQDLTVHGPPGAGVFWAAIVSTVGRPPVMWVRSNPIYVRAPVDPSPPQAPAEPTIKRSLRGGADPAPRLELSKATARIDAADS